jgi:hypothetical protein
MTDASHFARAARDHYTSDERIIELYSALYDEMHNKNLLDANFISQMSCREKTIQRLSELIILKYCTRSIKEISSKKKGPDIIFNFETHSVNIEVITPVQATQKKSKFAQFSFPPRREQATPRSIVNVYIPEMNSLHARITGALKEKAEKYKTYLTNKTIQHSDINIICINIGFIEGNDLIDYPYLKNLFTRQAAIHIEINQEKKNSPKIIDLDFQVTKENNTILKTSYFDNSEFAHIDGAWIISCNEKNLNTIAQKLHPTNADRNVMHQNINSRIPASLLSALQINSPQQEDFIQHIRAHGELPGTK